MKILHSLQKDESQRVNYIPYSFKKISPSYGPGGIGTITEQVVLFKQVPNLFLISCKIEMDLFK
jgi:hypothetical protein